MSFSYLKEKIKKAPDAPGVYLFKDKSNNVLYLGRAVSLKKRLKSYLSKNLEPRLNEMVSLIKKVDWIKTKNLLEAVILEANLIKKYWPKYNIRERDNRSFVYLLIPKNTEFPQPFIIRGRELEKLYLKQKSFEVFGPFQSYSLLKDILKIIRPIFPYSTCKINSGKPCFDYQIGLCPGACIGKIDKESYQKNIKNLILFLKGEKRKLFQKLKRENPEKIRALKQIQDVILIKKESPILKSEKRIEGYDISHFSGKESVGAMVVFLGNEPQKSEYRLFKIKSAPKNDDLRALKEVILRRFNHPEWQFPDLILIDGGKPQVDFIFKTLKEKKIKIPIIGISKYKKDELIFPYKTSPSFKKLAQSLKNLLLQVREEAHRFSNSFRKRISKLKN